MFIPSLSSQGPCLDQAMRDDLAASVERLGRRAAAILPQTAQSEVTAEHIRRHRIDPGVFARYYELVFALQAGDHVRAARLWSEIADLAATTVTLENLPYDAVHLGDDAERFQRLFTLGTPTTPHFLTPNSAELEHFQVTVPAALTMLEGVHTAWALEVRGLLTRILAVVPPAEADAVSISGGSSLMVWGAILINVAGLPDRIRTLSVIAHEATHQFLFGQSRSELLVTNPVEHRFCTELRPVLRPMNAVYHSTYVSGRIHALFEILAGRASLTSEERRHVGEVSDLQRQRFDQGCEVILRHGQLTGLGRSLIEEARDVLASAIA